MKGLITEQESIARAVVELVNGYKNKPCNCEYQHLGDKAYNLSLASMTTAPRQTVDITGGYTGEFPFALYLRTIPEDNRDRLDCEQFLSELAAYLEHNYDAITLADGREIEEIEQTSTPALVGRTDDGVCDYQVILSLRYTANQ